MAKPPAANAAAPLPESSGKGAAAFCFAIIFFIACLFCLFTHFPWQLFFIHSVISTGKSAVVGIISQFGQQVLKGVQL